MELVKGVYSNTNMITITAKTVCSRASNILLVDFWSKLVMTK